MWWPSFRAWRCKEELNAVALYKRNLSIDIPAEGPIFGLHAALANAAQAAESHP